MAHAVNQKVTLRGKRQLRGSEVSDDRIQRPYNARQREIRGVARFLYNGEAGTTKRRAMYVRKNATSLSEQKKEAFARVF